MWSFFLSMLDRYLTASGFMSVCGALTGTETAIQLWSISGRYVLNLQYIHCIITLKRFGGAVIGGTPEKYGTKEIFSPFIALPVGGLTLSGVLYYHIKLKQPITVLQNGITKIQNHDLDFFMTAYTMWVIQSLLAVRRCTAAVYLCIFENITIIRCLCIHQSEL